METSWKTRIDAACILEIFWRHGNRTAEDNMGVRKWAIPHTCVAPRQKPTFALPCLRLVPCALSTPTERPNIKMFPELGLSSPRHNCSHQLKHVMNGVCIFRLFSSKIKVIRLHASVARSFSLTKIRHIHCRWRGDAASNEKKYNVNDWILISGGDLLRTSHQF